MYSSSTSTSLLNDPYIKVVSLLMLMLLVLSASGGGVDTEKMVPKLERNIGAELMILSSTTSLTTHPDGDVDLDGLVEGGYDTLGISVGRPVVGITVGIAEVGSIVGFADGSIVGGYVDGTIEVVGSFVGVNVILVPSSGIIPAYQK